MPGFIDKLFLAVLINAYISQTEANVPYVIHLAMNFDELNHIFSVESHHEVPHYEVVFLKIENPVSLVHGEKKRTVEKPSSLSYSFQAFGKTVDLNLNRNDDLLSPNIQIVKTGFDVETKLNFTDSNCHYISNNDTVIAAISQCHHRGNENGAGLRGFIITPEHTVQISPVPGRLRINNGSEDGIPHIIHIPSLDNTSFAHDHFIPKISPEVLASEFDDSDDVDSKHGIISKRAASKLTIELGVYLGRSAYKKYFNFLGNDDAVRDLVLGYINQVQAIYLLKSLKKPVYITIAHLELQQTVPSGSGLDEKSALKLIDNFNAYQLNANLDMSVFLSANDFWMNDADNKRSNIAMGLASFNGVCKKKIRGVISEFGVRNSKGKIYPSSGWTSTYVTAHEIGHSLGMQHDMEDGNGCPSNGFIMSSSRGTTGETLWSSCSANIVANLYAKSRCLGNVPNNPPADKNHMKFRTEVGQFYDIHAQCQDLLQSKEARFYQKMNVKDVCNKLKCLAEGKQGYYNSGPASTASYCGGNNWCQDGECVPAPRKLNVIIPNWGPWKSDSKCKASCLKKSKGAIVQKRYCNNPKPMNTERWCSGGTRRITFCDDSKLCSARQSVAEYASKMCGNFGNYVKDLTANGRQLPWSKTRASYFPCAIVCKKTTGAWYTPIIELNDEPGVSAYFPDGTWCHKEGGQDYYCQNNDCMPENPRRGKNLSFKNNALDNISNNYHPDGSKQSKVKPFLEFVPDPETNLLLPRLDHIPNIPDDDDDGVDIDGSV